MARLTKVATAECSRTVAPPSARAMAASTSTSRCETSASTSANSSALDGKYRYTVPVAMPAAAATLATWASVQPPSLTSARAACGMRLRLSWRRASTSGV